VIALLSLFFSRGIPDQVIGGRVSRRASRTSAESR
jgi:hypothetical protein